MANFVEKVKAKVEHALHKDESPHSTNAGPHNSNIANKADPLVDSDRDGSRNLGAAAHGPGAHHTGHNTAGPHSTDAGNKLDPRVDSDRDGSRNAGAAEFGPGSHHTSATHTAGPHSSDLLNKADPRVDSDRSGAHTGAHTGTGAGFGSHTTHTGATHTAGPHSSDLLNKADPRVDSDRSGAQFGTGAHSTGTHTGTGAGFGSHTTHTGATHTAGPHSSDLLNKADPRVDSDRSGAQFGTGAHSTGTHTGAGAGFGSHTGPTHTAGPHNSDLLNKADPRVDSDRSGANFGTGAHTHGGIGGTTGHGLTSGGPAPHTAGPHSSDLANKLDPRVDSDRDGSKTVGGNTTY